MKRSVFLTAVLLPIIAGLLLSHSGCGRPSRAEPDTSGGANSAFETVERVRAGRPVRQALTLYTTQPGRVQAFEETPLYSKIAGYVDEIRVDIGDRVSLGQTLVQLWVPEMHDELQQQEALVAQAKAELRQAEAAVAAATAAVRTAAARVKGREAGVVRADGEYERWSAEYGRLEELAARGSVTEKLVDETRHQRQSAEGSRAEAQAAIDSAQAALEESQAHVHKAEADQNAAEARLDVAQANLARSRTMLQYSELKAPFDGVITQRNVDTRHYVHPGNGAGEPLIVVARLDAVRVCVDIPEREAEMVTAGEQSDPATVTIPGLGNRSFDASVTRTGWSLASSNRSLRTEIDIDNRAGLLRPGMFATVRIRLESREDALILPVTAVVREGADSYCCVVKDGKIEHRPLELGVRSGNEIEILSGISESDTVVLAGAGALTPGQAVEVMSTQ